MRLALASLSVLFLVASSSEARATEVGTSRSVGLGFAIGTPTSLVGKVFTSRENAVDFGLGFWNVGFCSDDNRRRGGCDGYNFSRITINTDYLWQDSITRGGAAQLDWHIGVGGRVWIWDGDGGGDGGVSLAGRMPIGLDLTFRKPSFLEVFLELAPALYVTPGLGLDIEAFLGVRFYP